MPFIVKYLNETLWIIINNETEYKLNFSVAEDIGRTIHIGLFQMHVMFIN